MNRHFGKTLATQDSHIHQTTISFTYTSNHHKLHIYIKPPQASHIHFTYTSNHHKLHIYIKPKLHIYNKPQDNKGMYMGDRWKKRVWEEVHFNMKQNRFNAKYG